MITNFMVLLPGEPDKKHTEDWPESPGYRFFVEKLGPIIKGDIARLNVFWKGRYTDMFVDDIGALKGLPRNDKATAIYRNNVLFHQKPTPVAEELPAIYGPAVLISRPVWR